MFSNKKEIDNSGQKFTLTEEEIYEQLRRACWDLYVSNLPKPIVVNAQTDRKQLPKELQSEIPKGFFIMPDTWTTVFNSDDMPKFNNKSDALDYARSIGQHETSHFTLVPGSKREHIRLVDAALKGFSQTTKQNSEQAAALANMVLNVFGDWTGDYQLGNGMYGREDFSNITRMRMSSTIEHVASQTKDFSPLWKVLVGTYERMFNYDFGLKKHTSLSSLESNAISKCVEIMGNDFHDKDTWYSKTQRIASTLENIILNSSNQAKKKGKGEDRPGSGVSVPDDVEKQMGKNISRNRYEKGKKGKISLNHEGEGEGPDNVDEEILREVFDLNRDSPKQFAGTLGSFMQVNADDALRLMYRIRARENLIKVTEEREKASFATPSYRKPWNLGDPLLGRGALEITPSMQSTGAIIPGLTTVKRTYDLSDVEGSRRQIADMLFVVDSSGSMNWQPTAEFENNRGSFDKAILAAESAALYVLDKGAKVAIINFAGQNQVSYQDFTRDLTLFERVLMRHYNGGTDVPIVHLDRLLTDAKNRVVTAFLSDFAVSNPDETVALINKQAGKNNPFYLFDLAPQSPLGISMAKINGVYRFPIETVNDLSGIVIGKMRREYEQRYHMLSRQPIA